MEVKSIRYVIIKNGLEYSLVDLKSNQQYEIKDNALYLGTNVVGKVVRKSHSLEMAEDILSNLTNDHENAKRYVQENE